MVVLLDIRWIATYCKSTNRDGVVIQIAILYTKNYSIRYNNKHQHMTITKMKTPIWITIWMSITIMLVKNITIPVIRVVWKTMITDTILTMILCEWNCNWNFVCNLSFVIIFTCIICSEEASMNFHDGHFNNSRIVMHSWFTWLFHDCTSTIV